MHKMVRKTTFPHELVGQEIEVVDSTNPDTLGIKGKVVDETRSTLKVEMEGKIKTLLKNAIKIKLSDGMIIDGTSINKRPEDRIKG
tara:strand:+ start:195 stop:452 length:258 start_codon:yes stop_codon:yes gene_type:complete